MTIERKAGEPWNEQAFFAEARTRSETNVAGLRRLYDSALSFKEHVDLIWGAGDLEPRFIVRRAGSKSGELLSGWASGGVGVQVENLIDLLGGDAGLLAELSIALGLPGWLDAKEPRFDAASLERAEPRAAINRVLAAIANLGRTDDWGERANSASSAPSTWLLLTFGDERQYAGNQGYEDDPARVYRYDSFVPNHRQLAAGDGAILKAPDRTLGCARIERIEQHDGTKERQRCPQCRTTALKTRRTVSPRYRCDMGHEFDAPLTEEVPCRKFAAHFGDSFAPTDGDVDVAALRAACPNYNGQLAMQRIDRGLIEENRPLRLLAAALGRIDAARSAYLLPEDAALAGPTESHVEPAPYVPSGSDTREAVMRQLRARRGQARFRQQLRATHGDACMATGCMLIDLLEAAHISPYRGEDDHHVENGLLLRADIHTLFDLDLLGVQPDDLVVRVHPAAQAAGYGHLDGQSLRFNEVRPSRAALESRWVAFQMRLRGS